MNEIDYAVPSALTEPVDAEAPHVGQPPAAEDTESYLCGNAGNAHPYANAGRDQDNQRADEHVPASPFARYVS